MTAFTWCKLVVVSCHLLALGEAANLLFLQANSKNNGNPTPLFYKHFGTQVDALAAAVEFDTHEQLPHLTNSSSSAHGSDVLKQWSKDRASQAGRSLNARGNHSRLHVEKLAHDIMREALSAVKESRQQSGGQQIVPTVSQKALASSGRNLLKQWSSSRNKVHEAVTKAASPREAAPPLNRAAVAKATQRATRAKQGVVPTAAANHSKNYTHAHALMHAMDTSGVDPATLPIEHSSETSSFSVASGSDLLAHWSQVQDKHKAAEDISNGTARAPADTSVSAALQPRPVSIKQDLWSMRSALRDWQTPREAPRSMKTMDTDMLKETPRPSESMDTDILKESNAMQHVSKTKPLLADAVLEGAQTLENWQHKHAHSMETAKVARDHTWKGNRVNSQDGQRIKSIKEDVASLREAQRVQEVEPRANHAHQMMRSLGDALVVEDPHSLVLPTQEGGRQVGVEELEKWSRDHSAHPPILNMKVFAKAHLALTPVHAMQEGHDSKQGSGSNVETKMAAADLRQSIVHDAMKSVTVDAPDVTMLNPDLASSAVDTKLKKVGADALEQWSRARDKVRVSKWMGADPAPKVAASSARASVSNPSIPIHVPDALEKMHQWRVSAAHDAMRELTNDVPDGSDSTDTHMVSSRMKYDGADALEKWSKAHRATQNKFMPSQPIAQEHAASVTVGAIRTPEVPQAVVSSGSTSSSAQSVQAQEPDVVVKMQQWRTSAVHDAMREMTNGIQDDIDSSNSQAVSPSMKYDGAEALEKWSEAHRMAQHQFVPPVPVIAEHVVPANVAAITAPVVSEDVQNTPHAVRHMQLASQRWHDSQLHQVMREMGDAPEADAVSPQEFAPIGQTSSGADELMHWEEAHKAQIISKPILDKAEEQSFKSRVTARERAPQQAKQLAVPEKESSLKRLQSSAAHSAMHEIGIDAPPLEVGLLHDSSGVPPTRHEGIDSKTLSSPEQVIEAEPKGKSVLDSWSSSHSEGKHSQIVNMYPPTEAPPTDILALALAREGNKASISAVSDDSRVHKLHETLQSVVGSLSNLASSEETDRHPTKADATAGSDILSHWAKTHPGLR
jgi:hypothetical protein